MQWYSQRSIVLEVTFSTPAPVIVKLLCLKINHNLKKLKSIERLRKESEVSRLSTIKINIRYLKNRLNQNCLPKKSLENFKYD